MIDLRSKARQRLLAYYFGNPTARLHLRDLAERLDIDPANLSKELQRLGTEGLFRSEVSGRQKYFQLNPEYPLFAEVRSIVSKTVGAAALIARSLKKIQGIEEAHLYGSFASNQQDAVSDIDVLVIGVPRADALAEVVRKLERRLGRDINYTVLTRKEFEARRARKDAFLENVWHNKRILLIGPNEKTQAAHAALSRHRRTLLSFPRSDSSGHLLRKNLHLQKENQSQHLSRRSSCGHQRSRRRYLAGQFYGL
jgi:predicted nucleotidyltransferase